ncbi:hypothetical protein NBRC111894_212 [Sporolactobacillus inulinus]|uniref:Uncharacterized protein n=1 Tax=Sporolactobacillus inulinus TaxID=2078 RepID=A0A4Y1Z6W1_9BACL|nr:hypothetical protein NBRC111894_212 [Sporolactobacillus inulinus]
MKKAKEVSTFGRECISGNYNESHMRKREKIQPIRAHSDTIAQTFEHPWMLGHQQ